MVSTFRPHLNGLVQQRCNSNANALELTSFFQYKNPEELKVEWGSCIKATSVWMQGKTWLLKANKLVDMN